MFIWLLTFQSTQKRIRIRTASVNVYHLLRKKNSNVCSCIRTASVNVYHKWGKIHENLFWLVFVQHLLMFIYYITLFYFLTTSIRTASVNVYLLSWAYTIQGRNVFVQHLLMFIGMLKIMLGENQPSIRTASVNVYQAEGMSIRLPLTEYSYSIC